MIRHHDDMRSECRENMRGGAGAVSIRHLFDSSEFKAPVRLCARLSLPPGAGIGPHTHETEDEVYVVIAGSGLLDEGDGERRLTAGDAVLTGRGATHAIRNDGSEDLELFAFIARYPEAPADGR
jgi:mannose-6-phosphate isomerase-like protein (cupin superfamily)